MKVGDRIRVRDIWGNLRDYTVEEFRFCLGVFQSTEHRKAGKFVTLCNLYESGPESKTEYIPNFGEYVSNQVQAWMDLPKN